MENKELITFTMKGKKSSVTMNVPWNHPWFCAKSCFNLTMMEEYIQKFIQENPDLILKTLDKFVNKQLSERRVYRVYGGVDTLLCVYYCNVK